MLADSGWVERYRELKEEDLKPNDKFQRDQLFASERALRDMLFSSLQ